MDIKISTTTSIESPLFRPYLYKSSTIYRIQGQFRTPVDVFRIYPDFLTLRNTLISLWPGVLIPVIPSINISTVSAKLLSKDTCSLLTQMLLSILANEYLAESQETQIFLSGQGCFEDLFTPTKPDLVEISRAYQTYFPEFLEDLVLTAHEELRAFERQLQDFLENLMLIKKHVKVVHRSHNEFQSGFLGLIDLLQNQEQETASGANKEQFEQYAVIFKWIGEEANQILALLDAIKSNISVERRLEHLQIKLGKQARKLDKKLGKDKTGKSKSVQKIERKYKELQDEEHTINILFSIVTTRLHRVEIQNFRNGKTERLSQLVRFFLKFSTNYFRSLIDSLFFTFNKHLTQLRLLNQCVDY